MAAQACESAVGLGKNCIGDIAIFCVRVVALASRNFLLELRVLYRCRYLRLEVFHKEEEFTAGFGLRTYSEPHRSHALQFCQNRMYPVITT